jgi:Domain of unknown function (DUF3883)
VHARIGLRFEGEPAASGRNANAGPSEGLVSAGELQEEDPPPIAAETSNDQAETTLVFRALRQRRPTDGETRALGLAGECLVMERERRRLLAAGRADLAGKVAHTVQTEGDGAGLDITSYFADGRTKFVEVKTTTGPKDTDFIITANEVKFSATHSDSYELCRVFLYDIRLNRGRCSSILGDITKRFRLSATEYRAKLYLRPLTITLSTAVTLKGSQSIIECSAAGRVALSLHHSDT